MKNYKNVGYAAMRMQGLHIGHFNLISRMLKENDIVIIGLGSTQVQGTLTNPYSPKQRIEMVKILFGDSSKIKIVPLKDLGAVTKQEWVSYCMNEINKKGLPTPTRYYTGSETDGSWFTDAYNLNNELIELVNLNRYSTGLMSASDVRKSIANAIVNPELTAHEWKQFVPECLHDYLIENFPAELTLEYNLNQKKG